MTVLLVIIFLGKSYCAKKWINTIYNEYLFFVFKNKYDLCPCFINTLIIEL